MLVACPRAVIPTHGRIGRRSQRGYSERDLDKAQESSPTADTQSEQEFVVRCKNAVCDCSCLRQLLDW